MTTLPHPQGRRLTEPDGELWFRLPREIRKWEGVTRTGRDLAACLCELVYRKPWIRLTDAQIADLIGWSRRYVQKGLRELDLAGKIRRVCEIIRDGAGTRKVRTIFLLFAFRSPPAKSKDAKDLTPKKFVHPLAQRGHEARHGGAEVSSYEESRGEKQDEAGGGVCPMGAPAPGLEEPEPEDEATVAARTAEAAAAIRAMVSAPSAAPDGRKGPVAPSPAPGTVDPPSNGHGRATGGFLASLVRGLRPSLADETRRLAAAGDPIARAELAAIEAAAPPPDPAPEAPRPAAAPPEVGAPGGMDP